MKFKPKIGLRGKISLIVVSAILLFAAVLTAASSNFLAGYIDKEQAREAADLASLIENMDTSSAGLQLDRIQTTIETLTRNNSDLRGLTVYTIAPGKEPQAVASTEISDNGGSNPEQAIFSPLHNGAGEAIGTVAVHFDAQKRDDLIRSQQLNIGLFTNLGLLLTVSIIYLFLNKLIVRPIKQLTNITRRIGFNDWHPAESSGRHDEIGDLSNAFNEVATSLGKRDEEVSLLLDASFAISSALHVDKILQVLCEKIGSSQKISYCRIALLGSCQNALVVKAIWPKQQSTNDQTIGSSINLAEAAGHAEVLKTRKPLTLRRNGRRHGFEAEWEWALTPETKSALVLPLVSKGEAMGVLTLGDVREWDESPFTPQKINFYNSLVNQAAVAIENAMLYEKTEWQVCELSAMHNMSQSFTSTLDYQEVISVIVQRVGNLIGAQFASVLLTDESEEFLRIVASHNLDDEYIRTINQEQRIIVGSGPIGKAFSSHRPYVVDNALLDPEYKPWADVARMQGYSSLIALPLIAKGQSIGVICLYFKEPCQLMHDETDLLVTAANEAAISIENARIYESLQGAFIGTIQSLTETMGAKDSYTLGHLQRVSHFAEAIARDIGISGDELQAIRYAGYLHDVGKIGIPDSILAKPGKLDSYEFDVIRDHPILSERILKPVNFPFPVHSIVRHHHERYDGQGYPDNLRGEEIPLGARILFVADSYEAMTSDRPYRKALTMQKALAELEKHKGTQFDPRVVEIFRELMTAPEDSPQLELSA